MAVLQQIAKDYGQELPLAANAILRDLYVDDCISGASSIEEAISLREKSLCIDQQRRNDSLKMEEQLRDSH